MNGHWYGRYSGSNTGQIVIELDECSDCFEGWVYLYDSAPPLPSTAAFIKTADKSNKGTVKTRVQPLDAQTGDVSEWQNVGSPPPGTTTPNEIQVDYEFDGRRLLVTGKTDIGTYGAAEIEKSQVDAPSTLVPLPVTSWSEFKDYVTKFERYRYIFRGQSSPWRLRTPFHRTGRGDMRRFMLVDVPALQRILSAHTTHLYNLTDPFQNTAFLNLAQHHGYPTPLLDWSYSPYVAAFFAYRHIKSSEAKTAPDSCKVRIFMLDKHQWLPPITTTTIRWPHLSVLEPIAIRNDRLIPQQALTSYTTVDDIETYIQSMEKDKGKQYLQAIDLPIGERDMVMRELGFMGITAGSLFPGLDGACEELRERFFTS